MQTLFYLLCLYSCAVKCTAMSMDCPTYFREPFEPFDQQKWDAMAACAKDKHDAELVDYLNSHQNLFKVVHAQ